MASRSIFLALILLLAFTFQDPTSVSAVGDRRLLSTTGPRHPSGKDSTTDPPSITQPGATNPVTAYPGAGMAYPGAGMAYPGVGTTYGVYPGQPFSIPGTGFVPPIYPYYLPPYYQGPNTDTGYYPGYYPGPVYNGGGYPGTSPYRIYPAPEIPTVP